MLEIESVRARARSYFETAPPAHDWHHVQRVETLEARIVSDADNLDALGAVGIARVFSHGTAIGSPIYDPAVPLEADETAAGETQYNHLHKKILALPDRLYTDAGRELGEARAEFVREYVEQFDAERAGER